ncbi:uncharacterized protein DUF3281 [Allofrancisella inopinata]|uniref:DUF3281 family protein n=1 Tax=Allofrancisella inopinata TaxID=1085647 RepID=UPI0010D51042|nr:DUF3281 family protein [Allofrancisella inopinata]TDT69936.1 uncharacterized protein DUF3281 [Allofrancisella inopinata]
MNKKLISVIAILTTAPLLSSCGTQEELSEYQIVTSCNDLTCSIALDQVDLLRYTTVLGKDIDRVLKSEPVGATEGTQFDITWSISGGDYATDADMTAAGLTACESDTCSNTANPTGYVFSSPGAKQISVSGVVKLSDGRTINVNQSKSILVGLYSTATYRVPKNSSSTYYNATQMVNDFNNLPSNERAGISSISVDNNNITFTCEEGQYITSAMRDLSSGQKLDFSNLVDQSGSVQFEAGVTFTASYGGTYVRNAEQVSSSVQWTAIACGGIIGS